MEEIVRKLEEKRYHTDADNEMLLRLYEELGAQIRHYTEVVLAIQGLLFALLAISGAALGLLGIAAIILETISAIVFRFALVTKRLRIRVTELISDDPPVSYEYLDVAMLGFAIAGTSIAIVLRILGLL